MDDGGQSLGVRMSGYQEGRSHLVELVLISVQRFFSPSPIFCFLLLSTLKSEVLWKIASENYA